MNSLSVWIVNLKRNQPWILFGKTDAVADAPTLWPSDVNSWLTRKDSGSGKEWTQKEKRATEDEMVFMFSFGHLVKFIEFQDIYWIFLFLLCKLFIISEWFLFFSFQCMTKFTTNEKKKEKKKKKKEKKLFKLLLFSISLFFRVSLDGHMIYFFSS